MTRKLLGIGMAVYVEVTNGGAESEFGEVEITAVGRRDPQDRLLLTRPGS